MSLISYKVLQGSIDKGMCNLPQNAVPLGPWVDSGTGLTTVVFLMTYRDWAEEYPEEAKAEEEAIKKEKEASKQEVSPDGK